MSYAMEAAAENQKQFFVLDRPNPAGGKLSFAEGPCWMKQTAVRLLAGGMFR
jgi:uncharacterized protein YbbC (DUF1343 family)